MTTREVSKRTDKTPLGNLLSILMSFEVLARYLEVELKRYEASLIRFNIMSALFINGGEMTPSEIAESVFREKNSITAVINTMQRQGVVRREPSPDDRRSVKVVITDKGWREANRLNPIAQELSREALSCMDKSQTEELVATMRKLRESLLPRIGRTTGNGKTSRIAIKK
jgi:DNA-binding MarR family transcriptional regulator